MRLSKLFQDRREAGRELALHLRRHRDGDPVVVGLPRGGVPVAYEVARELDAPLDVCVVRKIGAPIQPELGIGAIAEGGAVFVDRDTMRLVGVSDDELAELVGEKRAEVDERVQQFRRGAPPVDVAGKTVIVVDDGIATGGTARAAVRSLRARGAGHVVLAAPVGAAQSAPALASAADEIVCAHWEDPFHAVGLWYEDFSATPDAEVVALLDQSRATRSTPRPRMRSERVRTAPAAREVSIPIDGGELRGSLAIPANACGLVMFAHGSGSSRHSTRNRYVAGELQRSGVATLLFDLLSEDEELIDARTGHLRFDIDLLASRLVLATDWVRRDPELAFLPIGYFGASTGAAAAIVAAAMRPNAVRAIVSRGGRPDLAETALGEVKAPTLLLVGGADPEVLTLNREALYLLGCEKALEVVPQATHLFEEPGALEDAARAASKWFVRYLGARAIAASA